MAALLFAQSHDSLWPSVIQALSNNGFWVFVGICVLAGTAKQIVASILKHRERIAMIDAGMLPDSPVGHDEHLAKTVRYEDRRG